MPLITITFLVLIWAQLTEGGRNGRPYSGTIQTLSFSVFRNVSANFSASSLLPAKSRTR
ncbi:hypothetical protein SBA2_630041 [Acidobacteriia bacterium SbA2]|nr:hypothetical protein SBA2_630041 [Acidobacteriia bacterium SbA2]